MKTEMNDNHPNKTFSVPKITMDNLDEKVSELQQSTEDNDGSKNNASTSVENLSAEKTRSESQHLSSSLMSSRPHSNSVCASLSIPDVRQHLKRLGKLRPLNGLNLKLSIELTTIARHLPSRLSLCSGF